jgi:hypothetical protein
MFLALFHKDKERNREIFKIAGDLCHSVYGISEIVTKEFGETAVLLGREPGLNPVWPRTPAAGSSCRDCCST